jgi:hypothetical protein
MKIPDRFQIFDTPVTLTYADQDRLAPHVSNYNKLHELLLLPITDDDLKKMAIIELMGKARWTIIYRLLCQINNVQQTRWTAKAKKVIG